jgi:hypothetical protein
MPATDNLTFKEGKGWATCGCGGKAKEYAVIPPNSTTIFVKSSEKIFGPISGIEYQFLPHQNSIDVDSEDAKYWLSIGYARPQLTGYKGRLTRTGVVNDKQEAKPATEE